ncbi:MAG: thioesterase family protein [Saprospiraceae bacterium]
MQNEFRQTVQLRWADMDSNAHMRHSVYYDLGASIRIEFLAMHGVTFPLMEEMHFGPVLFREEAVFRKEIRYGDALYINLQVPKCRRDGSRFSFRHEIRREDGTLCAVLQVDGAWIDTQKRKLTKPPEIVRAMFEAAPKTTDFQWLDE